ncbi:dihydrodipicolinate synthase family protein [Actinophytocola sp.]|uniref:dihydrodipicolinate synthase family protein n=1 Tax=Actinophytocola sp. TaxID=1872138 RepID=UPI003D6AFA83
MTTEPMWLYAIAPTQFAGSGVVDLAAMIDNAAEMAHHGIDHFLLTGAYGEFQSLGDDERVAIVEAMAGCGHARSLLVGASHPSTEATVSLARRLLDAGANLIMVAPPMLAELTADDVRRHFDHLAGHVEAPLVVYNNPVFGMELTAAELGGLAALGPYVAVKQGATRISDAIASVHEVRAASGGAVKVLAASDAAASVTLAAGFDGLTSTNSWVFPNAFMSMVSAAAEGRPGHMREIRMALDPYFRAVRKLGQPRAVKAAMRIRGYAGSSSVRLPYTGVSRAEAEQLALAVEECDQKLADINV